MAMTYEVELRKAGWRVEFDNLWYCLVIAKTADEAVTLAHDHTGDDVTKVSGPHPISQGIVYING